MPHFAQMCSWLVSPEMGHGGTLSSRCCSIHRTKFLYRCGRCLLLLSHHLLPLAGPVEFRGHFLPASFLHPMDPTIVRSLGYSVSIGPSERKGQGEAEEGKGDELLTPRSVRNVPHSFPPFSFQVPRRERDCRRGCRQCLHSSCSCE